MTDEQWAAYLDREGYVVREVPVVLFLDADEERPWFMRLHETVAYVAHPFDATVPMDERELLAYVRDNFGPEACAIY